MEEREIKTISFGKAARTRIGMYLSAEPQEALELGLREIYTNSLDAYSESKATKGEIKIIINSESREVRVIDGGPGIPNKPRPDKVPSLVAAVTLPHTGSHFDARQVNAVGVNGIGASVVTHTSSYFNICSINNKESCTAIFESDAEGAHLKQFIPTKSSAPTGVTVFYVPDPLVYGETTWFNKESLSQTLSETMKFYSQIKLILNFDGEAQTFYFPNGLKEKETKLYYASDSFIMSLDIGGNDFRPFGNRLYLPNGGAFFSHFKTQFTKKVNELSGLKLTGGQIQQVFGGYVAVFVNNPLFSNQSKSAISNKEVNPEISLAIKQELEKFSKTAEWEKIIKKLETELKAEAAAERAREKVKSALNEISKGSRKKVIAADKLKDCLNSGKGTYLAISEGDSACNSLALGRDINNVALFPVRGKFINTLKNTKEKFLENEELIQLTTILGAGIFEKFDIKKMKYENILIAVDADQDGLSIANLLLTFFYVCMPEVLREGRVYWMRAPLYYTNNSYIFDEIEWRKVKNKSGYVRAKGLGQYSSQAIEEAFFGKHKRWEQLKVGSWATLTKTIEDLMGKDTSPRQDILFNRIDFERITFL